MSFPRIWLAGVLESMRRECVKWAASPGEIFFCDFMPLVWMLVVWGLLGNGLMTRVPIGLVDEDRSSMSREVIRALDSVRSLGLESYENSSVAFSAMRQSAIYGVIVIPDGYMRETLSGRGSSLVLYSDANRYAVAGTFASEVPAAAQALSNDRMSSQLLKTGIGTAGAERILSLVHSDFYHLGNRGSSFLVFLASTLLPGLITIGATFAFMSAILRENWNKSVKEWFESANESFSAGLLGKLTPHFIYYCLIFLFYIALFSGEGGFAPAGSIVSCFFAAQPPWRSLLPCLFSLLAFPPNGVLPL